MQSAMSQCIGNMPKACPYAMALLFWEIRHIPMYSIVYIPIAKIAKLVIL